MALLNFNANEVKPNDFELIPDGEYMVAIVESEMHLTKASKQKVAEGAKENDPTLDQFLKLKVQILEGDYAGKFVFTNLNLQHQNEKAVEIAQRELSAICHAAGVMEPTDSSELHDIPMKAWINKVCGNAGLGRKVYPDYNRISKFKNKDSEPTPATEEKSDADDKPWKK